MHNDSYAYHGFNIYLDIIIIIIRENEEYTSIKMISSQSLEQPNHQELSRESLTFKFLPTYRNAGECLQMMQSSQNVCLM